MKRTRLGEDKSAAINVDSEDSDEGLSRRKVRPPKTTPSVSVRLPLLTLAFSLLFKEFSNPSQY